MILVDWKEYFGSLRKKLSVLVKENGFVYQVISAECSDSYETCIYPPYGNVALSWYEQGGRAHIKVKTPFEIFSPLGIY